MMKRGKCIPDSTLRDERNIMNPSFPPRDIRVCREFPAVRECQEGESEPEPIGKTNGCVSIDAVNLAIKL